MKQLLKSLYEAKKEIGVISKDSKNPFFKSKYFDINQLLEHVEPILHKHGLMVLQPIREGRVITIIYEVESGEHITSDIELTETNDSQRCGSQISYFRRYSLSSLLSIQATDDDGNTASKNAPKPVAKKKSLDEKGFDFLMAEGTIKNIELALKERLIKDDWKTELENQLVVLQNEKS